MGKGVVARVDRAENGFYDAAEMARFREEVLNILLAQLLGERGVVSTPEGIERWLKGRKMPDVLVVFQGLRTIIEGKINDHPNAEKQVLTDAMNRVEQGIAHIGIAVLYPDTLREAPSTDILRERLARANLRIAICSEAGQQGWTECNVDYLGDLLRRTFDQLVDEDVVIQAVAALEAGVERLAQAVTGSPAVVERWAEVLGIREPERDETE